MKRTALQKKVARDLVATLKAEAAKGGGKSSRSNQWDFMINGKKVTLHRDFESPPFTVRYGAYPDETRFTLFSYRERRVLDHLMRTLRKRDTQAFHDATSSRIISDIIAPPAPQAVSPETEDAAPVDKTAIKKAKKDLQKWVEN